LGDFTGIGGEEEVIGEIGIEGRGESDVDDLDRRDEFDRKSKEEREFGMSGDFTSDFFEEGSHIF